MLICLDFDGCLHDAAHPVAGRKMGRPLPDALAAVQFLRDAGHLLAIHSARAQSATQIGHIQDWLMYYGFPYIEVHIGKPLADVYIDDKGLRFNGHWGETISQLKDVERHAHERDTRRVDIRPVRLADRPRPDRSDQRGGTRLSRTRLVGPPDSRGD